MITIDGSHLSGSGTIVRLSVAFAALTQQPIRIIHARVKRPQPGLRPQHIKVVEAIAELTHASVDGLSPGSHTVTFAPHELTLRDRYAWHIGTAGSATMLASAVIPLLAFTAHPVEVEITGGLFQDYAPSVFHLQHAMVPLFRRMGLHIDIEMTRPGYVPRGEGVMRVAIAPASRPYGALRAEERGTVDRIWGVALSSHLEERRVSERMASAARDVLEAAGYHGIEIDVRHDTSALQRGAALAIFADLSTGMRIGADQAGALGRPAEAIGRRVATQVLEDIHAGGVVDRFAADQVIPLAAIAQGDTRIRVPRRTDHMETNLWLAEKLLGAQVHLEGNVMTIHGVGLREPNRRHPP